jgi:hypothetical protein
VSSTTVSSQSPAGRRTPSAVSGSIGGVYVRRILTSIPGGMGGGLRRTQTIIVKGDAIVVKINENQVVNWTQPADWNGGREGLGRKITGAGTIALQAHAAKSAVLYKNIRIRPLD